MEFKSNLNVISFECVNYKFSVIISRISKSYPLHLKSMVTVDIYF